ncbi:hypothetical protein [Sphingomonas mucosissima]|uniref:hypothetical protein n=1 Tax=Sphingomonas mucosissima TaxID=370959 RepID=UPI000B4AE2A0|nr:hypothetical protein [Sphingomonas mucosissima]
MRLTDSGAAIDVVTVEPASGAVESERDSHDDVVRHCTLNGLNARASGSPAIAKAGYAQAAGADVFSVGGFARFRVRQISPGSVTRNVAVGATLPILIAG